MVRFFDHWLKGDRQRRDGRAGARRLPPRLGAGPSRFPRRGPGAWIAGADLAAARSRGPRPSPRAGRRCRWSAGCTRRGAGDARRSSGSPIGPTIGTRGRRCRGAPAASRTASPAIFAPTTRSSRPSRRRRSTPTSTSSGVATRRPRLGVAGAGRDGRRPARRTSPRTGRRSRSAPAILNLTHRDVPRGAPSRSSPGAVTEVRVALRATAHRFLAGHRIRLSVASSMWPVVWPSPLPAEYGLHLGGRRARRARPAGPAGRRRAATPVPPFKTTPGRPPRRRRLPGRAAGLARSSRTSSTGRSRSRPERVRRSRPCPTAGRRSTAASGSR